MNIKFLLIVRTRKVIQRTAQKDVTQPIKIIVRHKFSIAKQIIFKMLFQLFCEM